MLRRYCFELGGTRAPAGLAAAAAAGDAAAESLVYRLRWSVLEDDALRAYDDALAQGDASEAECIARLAFAFKTPAELQTRRAWLAARAVAAAAAVP